MKLLVSVILCQHTALHIFTVAFSAAVKSVYQFNC